MLLGPTCSTIPPTDDVYPFGNDDVSDALFDGVAALPTKYYRVGL